MSEDSEEFKKCDNYGSIKRTEARLKKRKKKKQDEDKREDFEDIEYTEEPDYPDRSDADLIEFDLDK